MNRFPAQLFVTILIVLTACSTAYKAKPLPFKTPASYANMMEVAGAQIAARAYADSKEAQEVFGFNVRGAGMLPVQVVFDNRGTHTLTIDPSQTFLEDNEGNLWPILDKNLAYDRATRYAETKEIFKEGAYHGFLGAAAGALIGAAVGIIGGSSTAEAAGKGAVAGAAAGGLLGGIKGYSSNEAGRTIIDDLRKKTLNAGPVEPQSLAYGYLFFPGEASSARQLRLKLVEQDSASFHIVMIVL